MGREFRFGRRGQAAQEFLTTYGWAVLLSLLILAVMFYFGALNPDALRPARCSFPPESGIECVKATATTDGALRLTLFNEGGQLLLSGAECSYEGKQQVMTRTLLLGKEPFAAQTWDHGEFLTLTCLFDGDNPFAGNEGKKQDVTVTLATTDGQGQSLTPRAPVRVLVGGGA
jgi:hypothetical protein